MLFNNDWIFKMKILFIDDDPLMIEVVSSYLTESNYDVISSLEAREGLSLLNKNADIKLIIADINMPFLDGIGFCRLVRSKDEYKKIPIMMLTAKSDIESKYACFKSGADDYLTKPFDFMELSLRIEALIRRSIGLTQDIYKSFRLKIKKKYPTLTEVELNILSYLLIQKEPVLSEKILVEVFKFNKLEGNPSLVRIHIKNIRSKIEENPCNPIILTNIPKKGYFLNKETLKEKVESINK